MEAHSPCPDQLPRKEFSIPREKRVGSRLGLHIKRLTIRVVRAGANVVQVEVGKHGDPHDAVRIWFEARRQLVARKIDAPCSGLARAVARALRALRGYSRLERRRGALEA